LAIAIRTASEPKQSTIKNQQSTIPPPRIRVLVVK